MIGQLFLVKIVDGHKPGDKEQSPLAKRPVWVGIVIGDRLFSFCIADPWELRYMKIVSAPRNHAGRVIRALAMADQRENPSGSTKRGRRCEGGMSVGGDGNLVNKVVLRYHRHNWSKAERIIFASVRATNFLPTYPRNSVKLESSEFHGTKQVKHDP